jgi:glycogen synthase
MRALTRSRPRKVLMTTDAVGGVFTYAIDLAHGLAAEGVVTVLAVLGPELSPDQRAQAEAVPGLELIVTGIALDWLAEEPALVTAAGDAVADLARRSRAELVHLNSPALAASRAFDRPVIGVAHSCLATWWAAVKDGEMPEDFRWRTHLVARGYQACDALIAPSAAFAAATSRAYGVAPPRVVHNGRRPAGQLAGGPRKACVVTGGRLWDEGKNLETLDQAAALMRGPVLADGPMKGPAGQHAPA